MIRSMTGYGTAERPVGKAGVSVELRSVNHRFLDLSFKLPSGLAALESEIRDVLRERFARGRISCAVQLSGRVSGETVVLDRGRLDQGLALLREAADRLEAETGRRPEIGLEHLLAVPELFRAEEAPLPQEELRAATLAALGEAAEALASMREREGRELLAELRRRLERLGELLGEVRTLAPRSVDEALERLRARLQQLVQEQIDPQRLAQEAAFLADRTSINEEIERLASHLEQFEQALGEEQAGRRLNFLLQEMHREVNTMGSKTNLLEITEKVVAMKDEVESLREQVQNLE